MHCIYLIEICRTFKIEIKTSVIHINRSNNCFAVITNKFFCMNESGFIFIDSDSFFQQYFIIISCHNICIRFVRDMGHNDFYIDSAVCRICKRCNHLIIKNKIRCHNMYIMFRRIQYIHVYCLSHLYMVKGTVGIAHNIAFGFDLITAYIF